MKKRIKVLTLACLIAVLSGCSAVMAASGQRESNLSAIQMGDTRNMVSVKIGQQPIRVQSKGNDLIEVYEVQKGNEPSMGRAVAHGTLDLFTFGFWEIIGTPLEATAGEKSYFIAEYKNGKLVNYQQSSNIKQL
ncbi:MAG: hypothetical protein Q7K48_00750 [Fusobacterium sp. JB021]|nr:hypothetical protein [Fusobacterium sp. JB021]